MTFNRNQKFVKTVSNSISIEINLKNLIFYTRILITRSLRILVFEKLISIIYRYKMIIDDFFLMFLL